MEKERTVSNLPYYKYSADNFNKWCIDMVYEVDTYKDC